MAFLVSRTSSDSEIDSHSLRSSLEAISADLSVPFLEKRARSKLHKKNPLDELNVVIEELTSRERELQAGIGIINMLLDKNDELVQKNKKFVNKKKYYKGLVKDSNQEISRLKEELITAYNKYSQTNEALIEAEEHNLRISAQSKRMSYDFSLTPEKLASESFETYENQIFDLKIKLKNQGDQLLSIFYIEHRLESEKKIKKLDESLSKSENEKFALFQTNSKLEKDLSKLSKKLKTIEKTLKEMPKLNLKLFT